MIESNQDFYKNAVLNATMNPRRSGFTLIEILMVILLIAVLALMGITQFQNYSTDAKDATTKSNLQVLRRAIAVQNAQMRLRCNVTTSNPPPLANLQANDITTGASPCTTTQVSNRQDRAFVSGEIPANPWGSSQSNTIVASTLSTSAQKATGNCGGTARGASDDGWCYNTTTGEIWANSAHNTGGATGGTEYGF
jgi:prepilin-type N-terminal cleavage/methylation domain-containing protein